MSYLLPNRSIRMGDTWEYSDGHRVHAIHLQYQAAGQPSAGRELGALGHAVSTDLLHWETLPSVLYPGEPGTYDSQEIWTGCTIYAQNRYWLFYTSRSLPGFRQTISAATSDDGMHFTKLKENPLLIPDSRWYYTKSRPCPYLMHGNNGADQYDCRDMCVVADPSGTCFWGFFAARQPAEECAETSVIGLARSTDLIHWEQLPPCFVPNRYHCVETPDVFFMNGKWYMLCLAGNNYGQRNAGWEDFPFPLVTICAVADQPQGPYIEPDEPLLLATMGDSGACAKTVLHQGKRYLFHVERITRKDGSSVNYMSLPKVVKTDEKGHLFAGIFDGYSAYFTGTETLTSRNFLPKGLLWGTPGKWTETDGKICGETRTDWCIQPLSGTCDNFIFEADIIRESAECAGLAFGVGETVMNGGYVLLLDYRKNHVCLHRSRTFELLDGRTCDLADPMHHLTLVCAGETMEAYLDGKLAFHHLLEGISGKIALFLEKGKARFSGIQLHKMRSFNTGDLTV